jgi:sec-independent protein translocase protein TatA
MVGDIFQPTHLLFVLVVALLVLGPKKLPEVGRQLGNGLRDFRAAINGERSEPEEVQAPYEQAVSDTAAEHEPSASSTPHEHELAHVPETAAGDEAEHAQRPDSGHEFAYEASESSDKRTDPLA